MNTEYRYILDKSSKKHPCPDCGKNTLVLYIDTETEEYLPEEFGRCDSESSCSYHHFPPPEPQETKCLLVPFSKFIDYSKKAFQITTENGIYYLPKSMVYETIDNGFYVSEWYLSNTNKPPGFLNNDFRFYLKGELIETPNNLKEAKPAPEPIFIPDDVLRQTLQGYEKNVFIQNLLSRVAYPFETKVVERVISHYYLGTICEGYRDGGITFPFIDKDGNVRAVQVKQFDKENHTTGTDFLHSVYSKHPFIDNSSPFDKETGIRRQILPDWIIKYRNNDLKVSCLFGEHLLTKYLSNPIALVEAPKTAICGTLYFGLPESSETLIWLAVYNKSSFSFDKLKVLQGRDVFVFPDLSKDGITYKEWEIKVKQYEKRLPCTRFIFSDLLERLAPNELKEKGADIADILIKMNWRKFKSD